MLETLTARSALSRQTGSLRSALGSDRQRSHGHADPCTNAWYLASALTSSSPRSDREFVQTSATLHWDSRAAATRSSSAARPSRSPQPATRRAARPSSTAKLGWSQHDARHLRPAVAAHTWEKQLGYLARFDAITKDAHARACCRVTPSDRAQAEQHGKRAGTDQPHRDLAPPRT